MKNIRTNSKRGITALTLL